MLVKLQLAEGDYIKEVNPFEIMFSQATINNIFQIGNDIENTINDFVNSKVRIENFSIIQVCIIDDIFIQICDTAPEIPTHRVDWKSAHR